MFVLSLLATLAAPTPMLPWHDAVLLATVDRINQGGPIYSDVHHSLVPAETPYFPGNILAVYCLGRFLPHYYAPRILGVLAAIAAFSATWIAAAELVGSVAIGGGFALITFSILTAGGFNFQMATLYPDYPLIALTLAACLLISSRKSGVGEWRRSILLFCLYVAIGLFKQSSIAVYAGLGAYLMFFGPALERRRKKGDIALLFGAGLVVCAVVCLTPNCLRATVLTMSGHPIFLHWLTSGIFYMVCGHLWLVLPALLAIADREVLRRPLVRVLLCVYIPFVAFQTLASIKAGAGSYDLNVPMPLLCPIACIGFAGLFRKKAQIMAFVGLAIGIGLITNLRQAHADLLNARAQWADFRDGVDWLRRFEHRPVLFDAYSYHAVLEAGLEPRTDIHTLAHYGLSGISSAPVLNAIVEGRYDLIVGNPATSYYTDQGYPYYDSAPLREYVAAMSKRYRVVPNSELPPYLWNRVMVLVK